MFSRGFLCYERLVNAVPRKMRFWFLFFSSVAANLCLGDTLRVSAVGREGEADTERMIIKCEDSEEIVFVKKEVLLGMGSAGRQGRRYPFCHTE